MYAGLNAKVSREYENAQHDEVLSKSFKAAVEATLMNAAKQKVLEANFEFAGLSEADFHTHSQALSKEGVAISRNEVVDSEGRYMQYRMVFQILP